MLLRVDLGGFGCTHGSEVPKHGLKGLGGHREEPVGGFAADSPREARAPVAPGLYTCAGGTAERADVGRESLAHSVYRGGRGRGEARQDELEVAVRMIKGRVR
jgi:hypothetical protein